MQHMSFREDEGLSAYRITSIWTDHQAFPVDIMVVKGDKVRIQESKKKMKLYVNSNIAFEHWKVNTRVPRHASRKENKLVG